MSDLIEKLSDLRSQFNCFDENERDAYNTLSEAIKVISEQPEPCENAVRGCTYKPDCPWYDGVKCNSPNDHTRNECDYDRGIFPESYNYDPRADVYYLAEKIGINRLYALVVALRGEPEPCEDAVSRQKLLDEYSRLKENWNNADNAVDKCVSVLKDLPSVTPKTEQQWISCSERLPKDDTVVLVCGRKGGVYSAIHNNSKSRWLGWWKLNSKNHHCEPIAWMPLPESYKPKDTEL